MEELGLFALVIIYYLSIIALTCYMVVNYSGWWILLLIFMGDIKYKYKNK
jgi:hypothetical protein